MTAGAESKPDPGTNQYLGANQYPGNKQFQRTGRWSRLCLKELRETLRDRRTLITLILMPLLVYPVLSMVFQRSLLSSFSSQAAPRVVIGVSSQLVADDLLDKLTAAELYLNRKEQISQAQSAQLNQAQLNQASADKPDSKSVENAASESEEQALVQKLAGTLNPELGVEHLEFRISDSLLENVRGEQFDIAVLSPVESKTRQYELIYRQRSALSQNALQYIEERLLILNEVLLRQRLDQLGRPARLAIHVLRQPLEVKSSGSVLSTIVPMILILMTVTGAVYPAIDLTAGERERGTLEMLMASPVPRFRLLLAKYVAVVVVAFLTALVNLFAMTITLWATGLSRTLFGDAGLGPIRILQILGLLILFAAFFSAVLLSLTSFARSFKEAQAYLIPLMLLSLGPGVVSLLPGLELSGVLAITPISNIVLLARDLCGGEVNPMMAGVAILSTALYTLAAIGVAAKIFGTDAVMSGSNATLQGLLKSDPLSPNPIRPPVSSVGGALLCLAVVFPIYFLVQSGSSQLSELPIAWRLMFSGVATAILFGIIPSIAARMQRLDRREAFQLFPSWTPAYAIALLLGFSVWPIIYEAVQRWGLAPLGVEQLKLGQALVEKLQTVHPGLILCTLALAPAVFEELFFRGYLFSALRASANKVTTIVVSSVLFGLFHVLSSGALSVERLLPSTMMGLVLGWLCYHSRSVLPGMVLHACHNGLLTMMAYFKDDLERIGLGQDGDARIPTSWLVVSGMVLVFGLIYIRFVVPRKNN